MARTTISWTAIRRPALTLAAAFIALLGAAPARAQPRMPTHVACVGDSITQGVGASSAATNYPARLQGLLGANVLVRNFGHSGATMLTTGDLPYQRQGEYTLATDFVTNAGADAVVDVIIMLGTNDSKPLNWMRGDGGTSAAQFGVDYAAMIDHFASLPTHPVVYLALPLDALTNSYTISGSVIHDLIIPIINQVAADNAVPTIDVNTPTAGHTEYFTDGVHPNDGGYVVVAGIMRDGLFRVPQVTLTSPTADAPVAVAAAGAAAAIAVTADASAGTVAIATVEVFVDGTSIGVATQPPFAVSWSGVVPGTYAVTATATDSTGAAATTDAVPVTVVASAGAGSDGGSPRAAGGGSGCGCRLDARAGPDSVAGVVSGALALVIAAATLRSARPRRRRRRPR